MGTHPLPILHVEQLPYMNIVFGAIAIFSGIFKLGVRELRHLPWAMFNFNWIWVYYMYLLFCRNFAIIFLCLKLRISNTINPCINDLLKLNIPRFYLLVFYPFLKKSWIRHCWYAYVLIFFIIASRDV